MAVADVRLGATDSAGAVIESVFARRCPIYAVYRTKDRLLIHFADEPAAEEAQRKALACLGPLRGEINGLIDGWRTAAPDKDRSKASAFDRRVADALVIGVEGDIDTARTPLEAIKSDVHEVRVSRARFQYLLVALAALLACLLAVSVLTSETYARAVYRFSAETAPLWLAAAAGAFGAFFSIATGIRNRTVLPDLRAVDNSADAVLRIGIGVIAATLLIFLLQSGVVGTPSFGNRTVEFAPPAPAVYSWTMVVVAAFTAGFLERLVPDLLESSAIASLKPATPGATPAASSQSTAHVATVSLAPAAPSEDEDTCVDRHDPADETPDEALPPARGGVATV